VATRPLLEDDLDCVAALERRIFPDPWSRDAFREALLQPETGAFALEAEPGKLAGYGICRKLADVAEVLNIAVDPALRGRGLGTELLGAMLGWLKTTGAQTVHLEVRRSNREALALYRRAGFRLSGLRRAYYRDPPEDALTMTLELGGRSA
jgi:ribosomal-protein-alanine N-acetyltransferase